MIITKLPVANWTKAKIDISKLLYRADLDLITHTAVNIRRSQPQFPGALLKDDATRVSLLKLFGYLTSLVWTRIVNDHNFVIELAVNY